MFSTQAASATTLPPISPGRAAAAGGTPSSPQNAAASGEHPQLVALRKIDALSERLQKEGKLLEALQCAEKSLILRGHIFGSDSIEVFRACKSVGEMCNYIAMSMLQQDLFDVTLELLKKAELLTEKHKSVRAVTMNNLACYYRKRGKLRTALNYARKALGIEAKLQENVKSADTHLNMCTILSELKRHEKAIVHARIALKLLLLELFGNFQNEQQQQEQIDQQQQAAEHEAIATGVSSNPAANDPAHMDRLRARLPADRVAVLAIAYHNLAVQQEFLRKYPESLASYEKATKVVTTHLGKEHPLVTSLQESYTQARKKMEQKQQQQQQLQQGTGKRGGSAGATLSKTKSAAKLKNSSSAAAAAAGPAGSDVEEEHGDAAASAGESGLTSE